MNKGGKYLWRTWEDIQGWENVLRKSAEEGKKIITHSEINLTKVKLHVEL